MSSKIVAITGTSRGIGRGLTEFFLASGWRVVGCSRGAADIEHDKYEHHLLDVTDESAVITFFLDLQRRHERVDALINNAGLGLSSLVLTNPLPDVSRVVSTNLMGTVVMCREAARL